jgi:hypothetical protein
MMTLIRTVKRSDESAVSLKHNYVTIPKMVGLPQTVNHWIVSCKVIVRQNRSITSEVDDRLSAFRKKADVLSPFRIGQVF